MASQEKAKVSILNPQSVSPEFHVATPGGPIVVKSVGDTDYPDASIFIGDHCVGFVEWHPESQQFNFHYYGMSDDEPIQTFENITDL